MSTDAGRAAARGLFVCPTTKRVFVREKYNRNFVEGARALRGQWKGAETGWIFAPHTEESVRQLHARIYGGGPAGLHALVTAYGHVPSLDQETIRIGQRVLVGWRRTNSGGGVVSPTYNLVLGKNVEMRDGEIVTWCGVIAAAPGTSFLVKNVDPALFASEDQRWRIERACEPVPA